MANTVSNPSKLLHLGVSLTFVDQNQNSEKFHRSILVDRHIIVEFGRLYTGGSGQLQTKTFPTVEKAAAQYWALLRGKVGKGYHVSTALTGTFGSYVEPLGSLNLNFKDSFALISEYERLVKLRDGRLSQQAAVSEPERFGVSPRTPKQGISVIETLTNPNPDPDALYECALVAPSERFLYKLVLSHPAAPDEALVALALQGVVAKGATSIFA